MSMKPFVLLAIALVGRTSALVCDGVMPLRGASVRLERLVCFSAPVRRCSPPVCLSRSPRKSPLVMKASKKARDAGKSKGFGSAKGNLAPPKDSSKMVDADVNVSNMIADTLMFALDVMAALQNPLARFLSRPDFQRLGELGDLEKPGPSLIEQAGMGLFPGQSIPAGTLVCFYPVHGIGREKFFPTGDAAFISSERDSAHFDAVGDAPAYRQYLIGRRPLFSVPEEYTSSETPIFIDVNPNTARTQGWQGSLVNDGCVCASWDEDEVVRYYKTSYERKNCVLVPFGPAPLMVGGRRWVEVYSSRGVACVRERLVTGIHMLRGSRRT